MADIDELGTIDPTQIPFTFDPSEGGEVLQSAWDGLDEILQSGQIPEDLEAFLDAIPDTFYSHLDITRSTTTQILNFELYSTSAIMHPTSPGLNQVASEPSESGFYSPNSPLLNQTDSKSVPGVLVPATAGGPATLVEWGALHTNIKVVDYFAGPNYTNYVEAYYNPPTRTWQKSLAAFVPPPSTETTTYSLPIEGPDVDAGGFVRDFLREKYREAIQFDQWKSALGLTDADLDTQFTEAFNTFLENKNYDATNTETFINSWAEFLTPHTQSPSDTSTPELIALITQDFFSAELKKLYDEAIASQGFFLLTDALNSWGQQKIELFTAIKDEIAAQITSARSVTTEQTKRVLILNKIFMLITDMIQVLQRVTASQASRLAFLTKWQKAYTDVITQLQTFVKGDPTVTVATESGSVEKNLSGDIYGDSTVGGDNRQDLNTKTLNVREKLTAWRSVISDEAKALQSNINQSNDAVSQQVNMGTAIISQLTTLLAAIYK